MKRVLICSVLAAGLCGCGMNPGSVAAPVTVRGKVAFASGKPVRDVVLSLQPAQSGLQVAGMPVGSDGTFRGEAVPGKYIWVLREQPGKPASRAALQGVPEKYKDIHSERTVEVGSGELRLTVN